MMDFTALHLFLVTMRDLEARAAIRGVDAQSLLAFQAAFLAQRSYIWTQLFREESTNDFRDRLYWCVRQMIELHALNARLGLRYEFNWQEPLDLWREGYGEYHVYVPGELSYSLFRRILGGADVELSGESTYLAGPEQLPSVEFERSATRAGVIALREDPFTEAIRRVSGSSLATSSSPFTLEETLWLLRYRLTTSPTLFGTRIVCSNTLPRDESRVLVLEIPEGIPQPNEWPVLKLCTADPREPGLIFPVGEFLPAP